MSKKSLAVAALIAALPAEALACAMCEASFAGPNDPLTRGFDFSILFVLSVTYGLLAALGGWVGFTYWRASARRDAATVLSFPATEREEVL